VLNQISVFCFCLLEDLTLNHFVTANTADYPQEVRRFESQLRGRSMLVKKARMVEIECVARGYLAGSGWKEYNDSGTVCGIPLPSGLQESDELPEPIFTPARKAHSGHDENIPFETMASLIGVELAARLRDLTLNIYRKAASFALTRGIIIADTKFEFGFCGDDLMLGDEVLTPDSSRFWPLDRWEPGRAQDSYDKQYVRDYLESIRWPKTPPAPELPADVVQRTRQKYLGAYQALTGRELGLE